MAQLGNENEPRMGVPSTLRRSEEVEAFKKPLLYRAGYGDAQAVNRSRCPVSQIIVMINLLTLWNRAVMPVNAFAARRFQEQYNACDRFC